LNDGATGKIVRRRRSWYRRRLRMQRTLVAVVVCTVLAGACWQNAARYFSLPTLHATDLFPDSYWGRANLHKDLTFTAVRPDRVKRYLARIPGVYPYSVVPGGIKNSGDLRSAAARDYAVRRHFAHFDYSQARLVRATEARAVYLSYRIRDTIFWTHRKVQLHLGELLLTDGKITARARCGNQISDVAMPDVSDQEPDQDVLDQPVAMLEAPSLPVRPVLSSLELPSGSPTPPLLFTGGFIFPYVPFGGPAPVRLCPPSDQTVDGRCIPKRRKPPVVPEPSTMVLVGSGLALILWRWRKTARLVAA
jgi:hypothetical protein